MAQAFLVNILFLFNNLIYFISERFFPKTVRFGALSWDREKWQKIVRLTAEPWELVGLHIVAACSLHFMQLILSTINTDKISKFLF